MARTYIMKKARVCFSMAVSSSLAELGGVIAGKSFGRLPESLAHNIIRYSNDSPYYCDAIDYTPDHCEQPDEAHILRQVGQVG